MPIFRRQTSPVLGTPPRPHKRQIRRAIGRLTRAQVNHAVYACADTHALLGVEQISVNQELGKIFAYIDALEERINGNVGE